MLSKEARIEYFKYLGLGEYNEANILKVQKKYFVRTKDHDGKYGPDTDKLIVNLYRVKCHAPHFKITEFRCHCGGKYCTGYPVYLSVNLLKSLESVREKFGPTTITSGIRCKKWNSLQAGSASKSRHTSGKAADIAGAFTKTNAQRNKVKAFWYSLPKSNFCYHGTKNMGSAVHCDVK